jgi:hypothetical protein
MSGTVSYVVDVDDDGTARVTCSEHGRIREVRRHGNVGNTIAPHITLDVTMLDRLGKIVPTDVVSVARAAAEQGIILGGGGPLP